MQEGSKERWKARTSPLAMAGFVSAGHGRACQTAFVGYDVCIST